MICTWKKQSLGPGSPFLSSSGLFVLRGQTDKSQPCPTVSTIHSVTTYRLRVIDERIWFIIAIPHINQILYSVFPTFLSTLKFKNKGWHAFGKYNKYCLDSQQLVIKGWKALKTYTTLNLISCLSPCFCLSLPLTSHTPQTPSLKTFGNRADLYLHKWPTTEEWNKWILLLCNKHIL